MLNLNLLDVFNETWKDAPKPFHYDKLNKSRKKNQVIASEAKRYTSPNPIKFINNGRERYNSRKLNKVLELSLKINNILARSNLLVDKIFLNFDFIYGIFQRYFNAMDYALTNNYIEELNEFFNSELESNSQEYTIPISILLQLICMYNMNSLNNYPDSIGLQLCSRLLGYYGRSDLITKFIDECDIKSVKKCALVPAFQCTPLNNIRTRVLHNFFRPIMANQYLKISNKNDSFHDSYDFFLCSKSIFIWIWMWKQGEKSKIVGEIVLPDTDNDFRLLKVYRPYESDSYEILIGNIKHVINIEENGKEKWRLSLANVDKLKQISVIGDRSFILVYEDQNYIDLYNLPKKTLIERKMFDAKIIFLKTNRSIKYAWDKAKYDYDLYIAIGLDNSTLIVYKVTCDFKNKDETNIEFIEIYKRQFTSYKLLTGLFELFKSKSASFNSSTKFRFIASFSELRCVLIDLHIDGTLNVKGLKALYAETKDKEAKLSLISFKQNIATFQFEKNLHLYFVHYQQWYTVPGVYSYVSLNILNNYTIICGIYKCELNVFLIQNNQKNYKMVHLLQSLQFSDEIFDVGILGSLFYSIRSFPELLSLALLF